MEYGGLGLGLGDASVLQERIHANGGNAAAVHARLRTMGSVLRHGPRDEVAKGSEGISLFLIDLREASLVGHRG